MKLTNPVLTLSHNNLALTQRCIDSVKAQDIETDMMVIDNNSTDGTWPFLMAQGFGRDGLSFAYPTNRGVSVGWNDGLHILFARGAEHVLVVGNDTWLPPSFYRTLLSCEVPFVTGVAVDSMEQANQPAMIHPLEPHPDFSAFLIRRSCWETVGSFDERMKLYSSDQDYHLRAHQMGIDLWKAAVPYYHERSSTLRLATQSEQEELYAQAHSDREFFQTKHGVVPGSEAYESIFR